MSDKKKALMVLGYTRTGRVVFLPGSGIRSSDTDKLDGWTRGDHKDASHILKEHGERETDPKVATWCERWSDMHRDAAGKKSQTTHVRTGTETAVRRRR